MSFEASSTVRDQRLTQVRGQLYTTAEPGRVYRVRQHELAGILTACAVRSSCSWLRVAWSL